MQKCINIYVNAIITISEVMNSLIVNTGGSNDSVFIAHNWSYSDSTVDIKWDDNAFVKKFGLEKDLFYVVYAGNIGVMQNVEIIIDAANKLKGREDIRFIIVGDGIGKSKLLEKANKLELRNVNFYPMQPPDIASHIYAMANVNVIPLKKGVINTALPSKTSACLSCGKPIIACVDKESEFASILHIYGAGAVVSPDNPDDLAREIVTLRNRSESLANMGMGAQKFFEHCFRRRNNVKVYSNVLKKCMEEKHIV